MSKMMSKTGTLSVEGMEEIAGLADRFKSVFPGLLEKKFSAKLHPGAGNKVVVLYLRFEGVGLYLHVRVKERERENICVGE